MGILYIVVPIAVGIVVLALAAFRWAVRSGQLDDLDTPAVRMLHDDEPVWERRAPSQGGTRDDGERGAAGPVTDEGES